MSQSSPDHSRSIGLTLAGILHLSAGGAILSEFAATEFWALAPWQQLPQWLRLGLFGIMLVSLVPIVGAWLGRLFPASAPEEDSRPPVTITAIIALILTAGCLLLRSENHILGDGLTIIARLQSGDIVSATEPLTYLVHYILAKSFAWSPQAAVFAFRAAGVFSLWILLFALHRSARDTRELLLSVSAVLTFGVVQFFAGYVENYTFAFVASALFLLRLCRDWERRQVSLLSSLLLLLAMAFHLSTAVLIPAYLLAWHRHLSNPHRTGIVLGIGTGLLVAGMAFLWRFDLLAQTFVPLFATDLNPYHLFSQQHLLDMLNIWLRNFALLPVLLLPPAFRSLPQRNLLLAALIPAILFTFMIDPKIGALRDWDLLSTASAPTLVALVLTLRVISRSQRTAALRLVIPFAAFAVLHTGSWLWLNNDKQRGYEFVKEHIHYDVHYSTAYYDGYRLIPWHVLVYNTYDDTEEAVRALEMHLRNHPEDIYNAYQLAVIKSLAGETQAAVDLVRDRWYPYLLEEPRMAWELSRVFHRAGATDEHEAVLQKYIEEKGDQDWITFELGSLLRNRGLTDSAWVLQARVLARRNMLTLEHQVDFALFSIEQGELDAAAAITRQLSQRLPEPYNRTALNLSEALARYDLGRIQSLQQILRQYLEK